VEAQLTPQCEVNCARGEILKHAWYVHLAIANGCGGRVVAVSSLLPHPTHREQLRIAERCHGIIVERNQRVRGRLRLEAGTVA
jgi:hypothetical protein